MIHIYNGSKFLGNSYDAGDKFLIFPSLGEEGDRVSVYPLQYYKKYDKNRYDTSLLFANNLDGAKKILIDFHRCNDIIIQNNVKAEHNLAIDHHDYFVKNVQIRENGLLIAYDVDVYFTNFYGGIMILKDIPFEKGIYEIYHYNDRIMSIYVVLMQQMQDKIGLRFLRDHSQFARETNE